MVEAHNVESEHPLELRIDSRRIFVLERDEADEIQLHRSQERLRIERKARRDAFERKQMQERIDFEQAEKDREREATMAVVRRIQREGIEATRKHTVPAYTFTRFPEPPIELQG
ncbi:hypothetical protein BDZ45DRAFT_800179 [Acephala macrosclerotiorum]|nr:hypothetical protein BDZ45DRAFT_800179 [Acephala macrosclerotiorum]